MDMQTEVRRARERIRQLVELNESLREQIRAQRECFAPLMVFPMEWRLTRNETIVLSTLLARDVASRENLKAVLYPAHVRDEMGDKIIDVYICKLRRKLRPFGIKIYTRWAMGWHLDPRVRDQLKAQLAEAA